MLIILDKLVSSLSADIGIDLGTAETPVLQCGKGLLYSEPTFVAFDRSKNRVVGVGSRAKLMQGRTGDNVDVVRPVRCGVLSDYKAAEVLLRHLISRVPARGLMGPRIMLGVPAGASDVECRAVSEAARAAGARIVYIVPQPLAAAVGAGLPVLEARGTMLVDIGGGTSQAAVMSMGGIIVSDCIKVAGDSFDDCIINCLREEHNLLVGHSSAEELKKKIGSALVGSHQVCESIRGQDLQTGIPRKVELNSNQVNQMLSRLLADIAEMVGRVLEATPPALASDIVEHGFALSGGGSLLQGMEEYLTKACGVYCHRVEQPLLSVVLGAEKMFKDPRLMRTIFGGNLSRAAIGG